MLRSHKEVQAIVLNCIASMTSSKQRHSMFEPYLRNFFVRSIDPTHIKILKLEIITNMASESNIGLILREFQSYITGQDKVCVAATIQAIGRCAASIAEVTDTCLNGLVHLLPNRDQAVVAESVVVIKKLLQTQAGDHHEIITQMSKLVDTITVPAARAAIVWVIGEYADRVPKIAPDVLRKMAKTFTSEEPEVKMQILNLATKLYLTNPQQTTLLCQYVFNLARYDLNYDIRDRARFMRVFLFPPPGQEDNKIVKEARKIFLASKPAPVIESKFKDREVLQLGSLSHFLNARAIGYQDLPDFPCVAPDPSVRHVELPQVNNPWEKSLSNFSGSPKGASSKKKKKNFYESDEDKDGSVSGTSDSSSSSSDSGSEESESEIDAGKEKPKKHHLAANGSKEVERMKTRKETSSSSSSSESSSSEEESSSEDEVKKKKANHSNSKPQSNLDLLLDFSDPSPTIPTPMMTPSLGGFLTPSEPSKATTVTSGSGILEASPAFVQTKSTELLSKMVTGGLQVQYRYTRSSHLYSPALTNIELTLTNSGDAELADIMIGAKNLAPGMSLHEFPGLASIPVGSSSSVNVGVNFNDTTQSAKFDLVASGRCHSVRICPS
jgi:AP-3 complex subunit beta